MTYKKTFKLQHQGAGRFYGWEVGRILGAEMSNHQLGRHHLLVHQDLEGELQ